MPPDRPRVHPRVAGRRGVDQLVQRHLVRPGQRQQQLQGGPALPGLQPGQRADRDAGGRGQLGQCRAALAAAARAAAAPPPAARRRSSPHFAGSATGVVNPRAAPDRDGRDAWRTRRVRRGGGRRRRGRAERGAGAGPGAPPGAGGRRRRARATRRPTAVHNYLGREGTPPGELLAAGRAEVTGYGGEVVTGTVTGRQAGRHRLPGHPRRRRRGPRAAAAGDHRAGRRAAGRARPGRAVGTRRSCTARTATAGRCATSRSASWPPARWRCTRPCCGDSGRTTSLSSAHRAGADGEEREQLAARGVRFVDRGGGGGGGRRPTCAWSTARWSPAAPLVVDAALHRPLRGAGAPRPAAGRARDGHRHPDPRRPDRRDRRARRLGGRQRHRPDGAR